MIHGRFTPDSRRRLGIGCTGSYDPIRKSGLTCFSSSNSAFASFRSVVSKPSVNQSGAAGSLRVEH
jgi:hypothetical protein